VVFKRIVFIICNILESRRIIINIKKEKEEKRELNKDII